MSFQDFGKNQSRRAVASGALTASTQQKTSSNPSPWSGNSNSSATYGGSSSSSLAQVSESLLQYQRNVGILEKIAQQLMSPLSQSQRQEVTQQYQVQVDVIRQLEDRLRNQLKNSSKAKSMEWIKLERDFGRVQTVAHTCRAKVVRRQQEWEQARQSATNSSSNEPSDAARMLQEQQMQLQQQIEQDRLAEEIMREREEEIRKINQGMSTVNQIYKDLAHIVGSQQEQVDQIETQMDDAKHNASSGLEQIQKAKANYNSSQCVIS